MNRQEVLEKIRQLTALDRISLFEELLEEFEEELDFARENIIYEYDEAREDTSSEENWTVCIQQEGEKNVEIFIEGSEEEVNYLVSTDIAEKYPNCEVSVKKEGESESYRLKIKNGTMYFEDGSRYEEDLPF